MDGDHRIHVDGGICMYACINIRGTPAKCCATRTEVRVAAVVRVGG